MKIKMLMSISGVGFALARGDETERFSEKDAHNLINSGAAVLSPVIAYETAATINQTTDTAVAALNVGSDDGLGSAGTGEVSAENTGVDGDTDIQDGQQSADAGAVTTVTGEASTDNAGTVDTASGEQSDAAPSASGKGKGKAN